MYGSTKNPTDYVAEEGRGECAFIQDESQRTLSHLTCPDLRLSGRAVRLDDLQEIPTAAIIRHRESLPTELSAEAKSSDYITAARSKLKC